MKTTILSFKNLIPAFFVCLAGGSAVTASQLGAAPAPSEIQAEVGLDLGRGPNCDQRGLCSVSSQEEEARQGSGYIPEASGSLIWSKEGFWRLEIGKNSISAEEAQLQFAGGAFELQEDFEIPQGIISGSETPPGAGMISKGEYPVVETDTHYIISFAQK